MSFCKNLQHSSKVADKSDSSPGEEGGGGGIRDITVTKIVY